MISTVGLGEKHGRSCKGEVGEAASTNESLSPMSSRVLGFPSLVANKEPSTGCGVCRTLAALSARSSQFCTQCKNHGADETAVMIGLGLVSRWRPIRA